MCLHFSCVRTQTGDSGFKVRKAVKGFCDSESLNSKAEILLSTGTCFLSQSENLDDFSLTDKL